jgi:hypothetical protein
MLAACGGLRKFGLPQHTDAMTIVKGRRFLVAVVILIAGASWFGAREYRCYVRGVAFARQLETIKRDAAEVVTVGKNKGGVTRFFTVHNIPFKMLETEAYGSLPTPGCAPLGCGTDRGFISVQVKFDAAGTVTEAPKVVGMYQDCL